jgi:hypothetical protein
MDKKYNLLYIHELVLKHIRTTLDSIAAHKLGLARLYLELIHCKEPYGVTSHQRKIIRQFELECGDSIQLAKEEETEHVSLSYREYKERVTQLDRWNTHDSKQVLYFPLYLSDFESIISEYRQTLSKPVIRSFYHKESGGDTIRDNKELQEYLQLLNECFDKQVVEQILQQAVPKEDEIKVSFRDNVSARAKRYLPTASAQQTPEADDGCVDEDDDEDGKGKVYSGIHFTDLSRVNLNQKYKYEKKQHFKDTVKQYQGLQNKHIPENVIQDVIEMIQYHGLYDETATDPYHKLTKDHVRTFLDEKKHPRYYEDLQLIFSKITNRPCPSISKYEKKLYDDFDYLVDAFLTLKINRKNFLNSHYVLRQLLRRQGYRIPDNDLSCLKTMSRIQTHDEIYQRCCDLLNWNFNPKS